MSFALTTPQILAQTKTVTRRMGWATAKPGDIVQPIEKGQGLKKGETVTKIGPPIRFVQVSREILADITPQDVYREGFPRLTTREFIRMFKRHHGCRRSVVVTRIEFEYLEVTA
jgi:hypothetical protein